MRLVWYPIGVMYEVEAPKQMANTKGRALTPKLSAMARAIGTKTIAAALLDKNDVSSVATRKIMDSDAKGIISF